MSDRSMYRCVVSLTVLCLVSTTGSVNVRTNHGVLKGSKLVTDSGREVFSFLGIPYAAPPIGRYRFEEPKPVRKWNRPRSALHFRPDCIQYNMLIPEISQRITGNEDCLYLNIFTPSISRSENLPVLVYFHGGAFMFGSGKDYNPKFFFDYHQNDIVHVSVNYRLGPFGFLSTQDSLVPGNNGLKDQVLALKWVKKNIKYFGGNEQRVTISGNSAGAASVHFHYLSPLSEALFTRGISSSGSSLLPIALTKDPLQKALTLSHLVECPTNSTEVMIRCLKNTSSRHILLKTSEMIPTPFQPSSPFGPVIEKNARKRRAFLSEKPYKSMIQGNISDRPWLTGVTTEEGLYPGALFIDNEELLTLLDKNWNKLAPQLLEFCGTAYSNQTLENWSDSIRNFYFKEESISVKTRDKLIQMIGERLFKADSAYSVRIQSSVKESPVFFYKFAYRGKVSLSHQLSKSKTYFGVSHFDDMYYILALPESLQLKDEEDIGMIKTMTNIWGNFVTTGNPGYNTNFKWAPVSKNSIFTDLTRTLVINSYNNVSMIDVADFANFRFWKSHSNYT